MGEITLEMRGVDFAYYDGPVLKAVDLQLERGELVGLIGPNGSGKTTLLKVLSGLLTPARGTVCLDGRDLGKLSRRYLARRIAVVPQEMTMPFALTAWDMVMLGRTAHVRPLVGARSHDREVARERMVLTDTLDFASRPFNALSGGEQQRVIIAMALAQEAELLLLDEPTVHLDINHQVEILELIKRLNREQGLTVLATIHDLNLAALYFDRLVLVNEGRIVTSGAPSQVLSEDCIRAVFHTDVHVQPHPTRPSPHIVILPLEGLPVGSPDELSS
jgi:iron complex transport system ATP-binding protein